MAANRTPKPRLTVVEQVYYQPFQEQPTTFESRYARDIQSDEQPYQRQMTATEDWKPLDVGWVEQAGLLVLRNDEGRFLQVNPTPEERDEVAAKIIEIAYATDQELATTGYTTETTSDCWFVFPQESMRATPKDAKRLMVRCQKNKARYTLYLLPL